MEKNLFDDANNPVCITKNFLYKAFSSFSIVDISSEPDVKWLSKAMYSSLWGNVPLIADENTYKSNQTSFTRPDMSVYLPTLLRYRKNFIACGDIYRKPSIINKFNRPILNQAIIGSLCGKDTRINNILNSIILYLFGKGIRTRFVENRSSYLSFAERSCSLEIEVKNSDTGEVNWVEVLTGGFLKESLLHPLGIHDNVWIVSANLDRLAMAIFSIPDIRYLWSSDHRILNQFDENTITKFSPIGHSTFYKEFCFQRPDKFDESELFRVIFEESKDLLQELKFSESYRYTAIILSYRGTFRSIVNSATSYTEIDALYYTIKNRLKKELNIQLR